MNSLKFALWLITLSTYFLVTPAISGGLNVPWWNWVLFIASAALLLTLSLLKSSKSVLNRWLEKDYIRRSFRLLSKIIVSLGLIFYLFMFYADIFLSPNSLIPGIGDQSLIEFTGSAFVLLVATSGICFSSLRAFVVFAPEDFPNRKRRHNFENLKRSIFSAGLQLFFAAVLIVVGTVLSLGNDAIMTPGEGKPIMPLFFFTLAYISEVFTIFVFTGFLIQVISGVNKLLTVLDQLIEELSLRGEDDDVLPEEALKP